MALLVETCSDYTSPSAVAIHDITSIRSSQHVEVCGNGLNKPELSAAAASICNRRQQAGHYD